jgi:serine/threonine-protein kinase
MLGSLRTSRLVAQLSALNDLDSPKAEKLIARLEKIGGSAVRSIAEGLDVSDRDETDFRVGLLERLASDKTLPDFVKELGGENQRVLSGIVLALRDAQGYNPNRIVDLFARQDLPKAALCEILGGQKSRLDLRRVLTQAYQQESTDKAALFRIVADAATEKDVDELMSRLTGKDIVARAHLIDILSRFDLPQVHHALEGQLQDESKLIRQAAITALGKMHSSPDVAVVCSLLCDPDLEVQNKATEVLIKVNHPDTVRHLVVALKDESEYARRAAVEVLNEIGTSESIKDLLEALGDDDWWVRARATDALAKIGGPRVVDAVLALIKDDNEEIRRAAIEILNATKDERAVGKLIEATRDDDWWVRERAADALAKIGDTSAVPALVKMLGGEPKSVPSAVRALAELGDTQHVPRLAELLKREEPEIRSEAINALAQLATADSAEEIRGLIADQQQSDSDAVRQTALAALDSLQERYPSTVSEERLAASGNTVMLSGGTSATGGTASSLAESTGAGEGAGGGPGGASLRKQLDITKLEPGDLIEERYEYVKRIGRGAFGTVLLMHDTVVDEHLILKFLNPSVATDEEMIKRFVHELRYSRKITHKNVIRIYDFLTIGGLYAISMEYFPSHTLGDEVKNESALTIPKALKFSMDIATGMSVAHHVGIIHRDLKPANVLINDDDLLKIVDFGVAAIRTGGDTQLTKTGYVIGSPKYMAPEQILGKKVDEQADIYSLGVIAYEMLSGVPPYTRGDHMSVMYQHVQGKAKTVHEINENVPEELSQLVGRLMSVDKSRRPKSMDEVQRALAEHLPTEA